MEEDVIKLIKKTANQEAPTDGYDFESGQYFNPMDASGGNFDDAFELGEEEGAIHFARRLLNIIEK